MLSGPLTVRGSQGQPVSAPAVQEPYHRYRIGEADEVTLVEDAAA
jgi:hypothetical protein